MKDIFAIAALILLGLTSSNLIESGIEVYVSNFYVSSIMNKYISQIQIPDKQIPDSTFLIDDGFNLGKISLTGVTISFALRDTTNFHVNFLTNTQFEVVLEELISATGSYTIEFPFFIEKGVFSISFPLNRVNFIAQLDKETDPALKFILTYNNFTFFSLPIELASKGYYFNKYYKHYRNDLYSFAKGYIELHLTNSLPAFIQGKPQDYLNRYLNKIVDLGNYQIDYSVVPESEPEISTIDVSGYLGFKTNGNYFFKEKPSTPDYPKPVIFPPPAIYNGDIVFSFSNYFINSVFYQYSLNNLLNYKIDILQAKPEQQALFSTIKFKDNITGIVDKFGDANVQLSLVLDTYDYNISYFTEGVMSKTFRYKFQFQVFDKNKLLYVDAVIGVGDLRTDYKFNINPSYTVTPLLNYSSLTGTFIDPKSLLTPTDLSVFENLIENLILVGLSNVNEKYLKTLEFKVFDFEDITIDEAVLKCFNLQGLINLAFNLK